MKPIVTISIVFIFLIGASCSDLDEPEENEYLRLGQGIDPAWMPDNSAVTARGLYQSAGPVVLPGQELLLFFSPTGNKLLDQKELCDTGSRITHHAWSNQSTDPALIYAMYDSNTRTYNLMRLDDLEGTPAKLHESTTPIQYPSWSSDNDKIVFFHAGEVSQVYQIDPGGGEPTPITNSLGWGEASQLRFARCAVDGPYIIFVTKYMGQPPNIYRIDLAGGEPTKLTDNADSDVMIHCAGMSPDGRILAYITRILGNQYQFVYLQAVSGGEPVKVIESAFDTFAPYIRQSEHLGWSPDGTEIVVGTEYYDGTSIDYGIYVVPLSKYLDNM